MGNHKSKNHQRLEHSSLNKDKTCPICSKVFKKSCNTYSDFDSHMNTHNSNSPSFKVSIPNDIIYPKEEKLISEFRKKLGLIKVSWSHSFVDLKIHREKILEDSLYLLLNLTPYNLRSEFHISFEGENCHDAGGLTKEWLNILMEKLFNEEAGLFRLSKCEKPGYYPTAFNRNLEMYKLAGILIGKAIIENIQIECYLARPILKHILKKECSMHDIKYLDCDLYKSLKFMKKNPINDVFFETFSVKVNDNVVQLTEDGENILVNDENKFSYLLLRTEFELYERMATSVDALIPTHCFS